MYGKIFYHKIFTIKRSVKLLYLILFCISLELICKILLFYLGTLCNGFIEKLIDFVVNLTDITLDTSSQFIAIFTVIQNKIPNLFQVNYYFQVEI